ncbi:binding-protein-dependent transport systems inner membrane component [Thermoclostridium stercorarium subsp. stercorarium DSM 8532]|jgi:putative aldouronate transport system permease protein|uniref:Binding-protein-dependent transport systems inner membrane component n=3 Tax=Thermoclostridium stercorarium TaxID=1510 RepID=L7VMB0_THES1|nr:carbohydrate ABC transporter permease [Thermoclostridium stercorarium]AGC67882.1 binding-protein-dependent transport systems inner membrane component [Thermoclostridium stercorarium subsp. stercorarium DSM 8532]AGI38923.1 ABC transporter permease subunit [Thermoclostridium stercorarium subsp. stercorarium DSM 8532]ANW98292.1 sugar ABC transporter permease [Thermoclostridium stercorarium subsp. thermolacticum DSM 2910]ANX00816.1 sugar ABC transporter permease [Thermoclostridium stercorarium s
MKKTFGDKVIDAIIVFIMCIVVIIMLYPMWNTLVISFNDALDSIKGGIYFWPRKWTLYNYQSIFKTDKIFRAFLISVARTLLTTVLNVFFSGLLAYVLSHKNFVFRKHLTVFMVMTMYINAGLIPQYFLYRSLGLINKFWVYILPSLVGAFNVIVIRTYINSLPASLVESAKIDGAGELRIYCSIIIPMCLPVLATVALWVAVGAWNSWFDSYIFAPKQELSTLQYEMMKIIASSMQMGIKQPDYLTESQTSRNTVTPNSLRAAMTIVATVPILVVYPFLQKYFVTINIGSVKE